MSQPTDDPAELQRLRLQVADLADAVEWLAGLGNLTIAHDRMLPYAMRDRARLALLHAKGRGPLR